MNMTWARLAEACGVGVAVGELLTALAHAADGNWRTAGVWFFYALAAGLLAFLK
jgi:hypothetical protein